MTLLAIEDLHVTYRTRDGDVPAVRGVDLGVGAGEVVGLAGESGSGKSTVASTVLRLQPARARVTGRVLLDGQDVLTMRWGSLRAVRWAGAAIVFQGALHALNPLLRVGDQIAEPVLLHDRSTTRRAAAARAGDLLERVGLPATRLRAYPHELSGGQRQRVMVAMALACSPRLLVADEPTTALDVMVQAQVLDLLRGLVDELGLGLLLISHDLSVLAGTCDRVAVMYAGRVVESSTARDVLGDPRHPYTVALAAAYPAVGDAASRGSPRGLPGDPPDPSSLPSGCAFHPRCPVAQDTCVARDPALLPAGRARETACLRIGADGGLLPSGAVRGAA